MEYPNKGDRFIFNNYLPMPADDLLYVGMAGKTVATRHYRIHRNPVYDGQALYVLEYVTEGSGFIQSGGKTLTVKAGDFYIVSNQTEHTYYSNPDDPFKKIWINLYGSYISKLCEAFSFSNPLVCHIDVGENMREIHELIEGKTPLEVADVTEKICESLFRMLYKVYFHSTHKEMTDDRFNAIKNYIRHNITNGISVNKICEDNYISQSALFRLFEKNAQMSPSDYINAEKIKTIQLMLRKTDIEIGEIVGQMKFCDYAHFYRFFVKHVGMSPTEYRMKSR